MSTPQPSPAPTELAPRLRSAQVGLRTDIEVHRHVFRGESSYVIRDPMTLAVHRITPQDYLIVAALSKDVPLGTVFSGLVGAGRLEEGDEEAFYRFVLSLHSLGFLSLPVPDDRSLYERREKRRRARRAARALGFLFMQIPVFNPDAFLARTGHVVAWAFSRWAVMIWGVVVGAALLLLAQNRAEFFEPLGTIFTAERLIGLWLTLVGMKVLHEFGHAYTCRLRGGEVPEMGVYLILGTPCAYVDATSSWGFTRRGDRIAVILAGIYVELFIAALAVFAWAMTSSAPIKVMAFDVVLVAGIATIVANLNPLMKFDGYYLLSDLLEIPNLRSTAQRYALSVIKRIAVGTPVIDLPYGRLTRAGLLIFGVAGALYKFTVVMGIAAVLATKAFWVGIGLAVFYAGGELCKALRGTAGFLIHGQGSMLLRLRGAVLALVLFALLPAAAVLVPVPMDVKATAVVGRATEEAQYAPMPGFIERVSVSTGDALVAGDPIASVRNDDLSSRLAEATARLEQAQIRAAAALGTDMGEFREHDRMVEASRAEVAYQRHRTLELDVLAATPGEVVACFGSSDEGRFVRPDEPIAVVVGGDWVVRAWIRAEAFAALGLAEGDRVAFRAAAIPGRTLSAVVTRVTPGGTRRLRDVALTGEGGGDIPVSPETGEASEAYYEIEATIDDPGPLPYGVTGRVLLGSKAEPVATVLWRSALRIIQRFERG
jgi:putative peptide zinc metalloprotease protein